MIRTLATSSDSRSSGKSAGSQKRRLALHLAEGMSISPAEALKVYGIDRLAARIFDLKRSLAFAGLGGQISMVVKRDPLGKRYARYTADWSARINLGTLIGEGVL